MLKDPTLSNENEKAWARLEKQIELSSGYWLGFFFSAARRPISVVRDRVQRHEAQKGKKTAIFRPSEPSQVQDVLQTLTGNLGANVGCVWLELTYVDPPGSIERSWYNATEQFFLRLNERRDALRLILGGYLIVAAHPEMKTMIREAAPDLWSARSIVVEIQAETNNLYHSKLIIPISLSQAAPDAGRVPVSRTPVPEEPHVSPTGRSQMTMHAAKTAFSIDKEKSRIMPAPTTAARLSSLTPIQAPEKELVFAERDRRMERLSLFEAAPSLREKPGQVAQGNSETQPLENITDSSQTTSEQAAIHVALGQSLLKAAESYLAKEDVEQAKQQSELALKYLKGKDVLEETRAMYMLAECEHKLGQYRAARTHIIPAIAHRKKKTPGLVPAAWYDRAGTIFFESGDLPMAVSYYNSAVSKARSVLPSREPTQATVPLFRDFSNFLKHAGEARFARGDTTSAMAAFEESLRIDRILVGLTQASSEEQTNALQELCVSLTRVGDLHCEAGESLAGFAAYQEALGALRRLVKADPEELLALRNLSVALNRVGRAWLEAGEAGTAVPFFEESLAIRRGIVSSWGKTPERIAELASSLNKLGWAWVGTQEWIKATACFEEVISATQEFTQDPSLKGRVRDGVLEALSGLVALNRAQSKEEAAKKFEHALANLLSESR